MIYIMQNNRMRVLTDAEVQAIRDDGTIGTPAARDTIDALDDAKPTADFYTIRRLDIDMWHVQFEGKKLHIASFMPPITAHDVGKRISRRGGILEVETGAERDERVARELA